jgi:4-carboxymuconolactone decarboxylase
MSGDQPRLAKLPVEQLDAEQRDLYDSIVGGPRAAGPRLFALADEAGSLEGPFNAMLLSPVLGNALQSLGAAVRYGSALTDRAREIAILVVAYAWQSAFEVHAHEVVGRSVGLTEDEFVGLRVGDVSVLDDEVERLVATTVYALTVRSDLTDDEFATVQATLGQEQLFELTTLVGYYATLALQLRVFRVASPS